MNKKIKDLSSILRNLLEHESVNTQEEMLRVLRKRGITANQSKISRTLHQLGAVKTKNALGQIMYQLPKEPSPPIPTDYADLITNIDYNEIAIIIHTSPGSASLIARSLDHQKHILQIMGTVAGDDTIIVIPKTIKQINKIFNALQRFLGIQS